MRNTVTILTITVVMHLVYACFLFADDEKPETIAVPQGSEMVIPSGEFQELTGEALAGESLQDDFNISFVGHWLVGPSLAVAVSENKAYLGAGGGIYILDISDPVSPHVISKMNTPGFVKGLSVDGSYLYVDDGPAGFLIVDISDSGSGHILGTYDIPSELRAMAYAGDFAYIVDKVTGLHIVDVSRPEAPFLAGSLDFASFTSDIAVAGDYAYLVGADRSLRVLDISDCTSPCLAGTLRTESAHSLKIIDEYAYIAACKHFPIRTGLQVVDISVPMAPCIVGSCFTSSSITGADILVNGMYAYVLVPNGDFLVIDIFDPINPFIIGDYIRSGDALDFAIKNEHIYLACITEGLHVYDISDPASPSFVGSSTPLKSFMDVDVQGNLAFTRSCVDGRCALQVFDVSDPASPQGVHKYDDLINCKDLKITEDYAWIVTGTALQIMNISDPDSLQIVGSLNLPGIVTGIDVMDTHAYIASSLEGLMIIDISNPSEPFLTGLYPTPKYAMDVFTHGNFALVIGSESGLETWVHIVDVSDPTSPCFIGEYENQWIVHDIDVYADILYIGNAYHGLHLVDISEPASPLLIGEFQEFGGSVKTVCDVDILGNYAYVANANSGVKVLDLYDPYQPTLVGSYDTYTAMGVDVIGDYIVVADAGRGLLVLEFGCTQFIKGDVDRNCTVNVADVLRLVDIVLNIPPQMTPREQQAADCNGPFGNCEGDGAINILDIIKIVYIILDLDACP